MFFTSQKKPPNSRKSKQKSKHEKQKKGLALVVNLRMFCFTFQGGGGVNIYFYEAHWFTFGCLNHFINYRRSPNHSLLSETIKKTFH